MEGPLERKTTGRKWQFDPAFFSITYELTAGKLNRKQPQLDYSPVCL